jgi:hypothetical protein
MVSGKIALGETALGEMVIHRPERQPTDPHILLWHVEYGGARDRQLSVAGTPALLNCRLGFN